MANEINEIKITVAVLDEKVDSLTKSFDKLDKQMSKLDLKMVFIMMLVMGLAGEKGVKAFYSISEAMAAETEQQEAQDQVTQDVVDVLEDMISEEALKDAGSDR